MKVMAKDLIRTRHQIEKFYKLKSQLQGVSLRIQVVMDIIIIIIVFLVVATSTVLFSGSVTFIQSTTSVIHGMVVYKA